MGSRDEKMLSIKRSAAGAAPLPVRAHHLLCAVCVRGGCKNPPAGEEVIKKLLESLWSYPYLPLQLKADTDILKAHYLDVYEKRHPEHLPENFEERRNEYVCRRKDLEMLRILGVMPDAIMPAYIVYKLLFTRKPTLSGICHTASTPSENWPECPHARLGYYEKIAKDGVGGSLEKQTRLGEELYGRGVWAMVRPRTKTGMGEAKKRSADFISNKAERLYIRPNHLLCILCRFMTQGPLIEDNLIELRDRMLADPGIPVTLVEGCCMVCDSCNIYHPEEHLCYATHHKSALRDLAMLEKLGLPPGTTLPARQIYRLIYERIDSNMEICGWGDGGKDYSGYWPPCGSWQTDIFKRAKKEGWLVGKFHKQY